jgi:putative transposase
VNGVGQACDREGHARLDGEGLETERTPPPRQPFTRQVANVLGALPKSVHAGARKALNEILLAEDRPHAERAIGAFAADYGVKWPKAAAKVTDDREALLTFFDDPAEHWLHLRTTNPIESSFSPVRARTRVTKGPGTRDTGLAMVFKLLQAAEGRWRAVNGPHLVALVRAGARFQAGKLIERPDQTPDKQAPQDVTKVAA